MDVAHDAAAGGDAHRPTGVHVSLDAPCHGDPFGLERALHPRAVAQIERAGDADVALDVALDAEISLAADPSANPEASSQHRRLLHVFSSARTGKGCRGAAG